MKPAEQEVQGTFERKENDLSKSKHYWLSLRVAPNMSWERVKLL